MLKHKMKVNKVAIVSMVSLGILIIVYVGMTLFFSKHFYFGTVINNINATGKTVEEVTEEIASQTNDYTLVLEGRGDLKEEIKGTDIDLKYVSDGKVQEIKDNQNPFAWILSPFKEDDSQMEVTVEYDKDIVKKSFDNLSYFDSKNIVNPESAKIKYSDKGYEIVEAVDGNKVKKDALYDSVVDALDSGETEIMLESANVYETPKYTSSSEEVINAKAILDKYIATMITYNIGDNTEMLSGNKINDCISISGAFEVAIDQLKVTSVVDSIAAKYNTYGDTRDFATSTGKTVKVSGGNYGWIINKSKEIQEIIAAIKEGQAVKKELSYTQLAASHSVNDIGNTYLEINLTKQHAWFYKNGLLVVDSDVVTGNMSLNTGTPAGTYRLNYKEKDATLKGEDYTTPVKVWMPFNDNIGLHDAWWRPAFGGDIYLTGGSHGCVNAPEEFAKKVFENIEQGTAVVCFNE